MFRWLSMTLFLVICFTQLDARPPKRAPYYRHRFVYDSGWTGYYREWPPYYAYYGYPRWGLIYQYSYPMDSSYFDSYPSTIRGWTYPSYPYNGTYYINSTPIHKPFYTTYRPYPSRRTRVVEVNASKNIQKPRRVFLTE